MKDIINQKPFNDKLLKIAGILIVIAVVVGGFYMYYSNNSSEQLTKAPEFAVQKNDLVDEKIPSGFPLNLPVERNSTVLQNYEATTNDGRVQSTRIVTTTKTVAEAIEVYSDFFATLGWVEMPANGASATTVLMLKGDDTLLISAKENSPTERSISLTLTAIQ